MVVKVKVELMLPDWWGADQAFDLGGEKEVKELVMEDPVAFLEEAKWDITQYVPDNMLGMKLKGD